MIKLTIEIFEINDFIEQSCFKYLLKKKDENKKFFELDVNIINSFNKISANNYTDYNIDTNINFSPLVITVHQDSLYFILNFLKEKADAEKINNKNNNIENIINSINDNSFFIANEENMKENNNSIKKNNTLLSVSNHSNSMEFTNLMEPKNKQFIYITNFILNEFIIYLTYESVDYSFSFEGITIPIPNIKDYSFKINSITHKGFATIDEFINKFLNEFLNQLSKSDIVFNLLKSLKYLEPFVNLVSDFLNIFMSPYKSYQHGKGLFNGLLISTKNFMLSIFSQSYLFGENTFYLLFGILGIKKKNKKKKKLIKKEKISKQYKFIYNE
jgi:hypothetical protein